jgi:hypothetical protein
VEKITPITEELKQLGSGLGNFPAVNPYKVPAGYFDEFPARMFNLVSGGSLPAALTGLPASHQKTTLESSEESVSGESGLGTSVTNESFTGETFTDQSVTEESVANESVTNESVTNESFTNESAAEELAGLSSILSGIGKKTPFTVPDNYFNEVSGNIISGAQAVDMVNEELENLSLLMESLKPINVYSVPNEYFGELPGIILNKVKSSQPAGSGAVKGIFSRRIIQYAAAAIITGLMITAGFFIANRNTTQQDVVSIKGLEEKAAETSDEEILNYLATQHVPLPDSLINANTEIKADAILDMLANVSDEELQQYLQLQTDTKILIN